MSRRSRAQRFGCFKVTLLTTATSLAIVIAATTISRAPTTAYRLVDDAGEPVAGAYIAYYHKGYRFNFVDTLTYERPGTILRTDAEGRFEIAGFWHLHRPLDRGLVPFILVAYAPRLHHAFGPIAELSDPVPGRFDIDRERGLLELVEVTDDPEAWSRSLGLLDTLITYELAASDRCRLDRRAQALRPELAEHLLREYEAFMARHGSTPRQLAAPPSYLPEEERAQRLARAQEQLEQEPFWGQVVERRFRRDLERWRELVVVEP